jgi:hypothetical protein
MAILDSGVAEDDTIGLQIAGIGADYVNTNFDPHCSPM